MASTSASTCSTAQQCKSVTAYTWPLVNYSNSTQIYATGYSSPAFKIAGTEHKCKLHYSHENDWVVVCVKIDSLEVVPYAIEVSFLRDGDDSLPGRLQERFFANGVCIYRYNFIRPEYIPTMGCLLLRDTLYLHCNIEIAKTTLNALPVPTINAPCLLDGNANEKLKTILAGKQLGDFEISIGNETVNVHKIVLAAYSSEFEGNFRSKRWKATLKPPEDEVGVFKSLINYMYTGRVDNISRELPALLHVAIKYRVTGLMQLCQDHVNINTTNFLEYLLIAHDNNLHILKEKALNIVPSVSAMELMNMGGFPALFERPELKDEVCRKLRPGI